MPEEYLSNSLISLNGYVLPHKSKISEETFRSASGPRGWNDQQGFYIYRNERLLVAGDWLGMFRKEEHYKLARIMIDLPNTFDNEWQIDIKKSIARPPLKIRNQVTEEKDLLMVMVFAVLFFSIYFTGLIIFMLLGYGIVESAFQMASALGTVGLQTIDLMAVPAVGKVVLITAMLLGRLEIFPLLILIRKAFQLFKR